MLHAAAKGKKDEFYTRLADIERELRHYSSHFRDQTVLCNCDDPYESDFFKFFVLNFNRLGLKKLISTSYTGSPIVNRQFRLLPVWPSSRSALKGEKPYCAIVTSVRDIDGSGEINMGTIAALFRKRENRMKELKGDGDFRSEECVDLLRHADIVVTNPPFSLFREYVAQLMEHKKRFLIVGHQNAITYKEIFPLIQADKIWLGNGFSGNAGFFKSPYSDYAAASQHRQGLIRVSGVAWFTNLEFKKRRQKLILVRNYSPERYPTYDNCDAIEVGRTAEIPRDYPGVMGVPITFLEKYCPEQFEIIRFRKGDDGRDLTIGGKTPYFRILIRSREAQK